MLKHITIIVVYKKQIYMLPLDGYKLIIYPVFMMQAADAAPFHALGDNSIAVGGQAHLEKRPDRAQKVEWHAVSICATILGKLGPDVVKKFQLVEMSVSVMVEVGALPV